MKIKSLDIYILRMWNSLCSDPCEQITAKCLMALFVRKPAFAAYVYQRWRSAYASVQRDQHLLCLLFETCNLISTFYVCSLKLAVYIMSIFWLVSVDEQDELIHIR